jgi:hypothetical protein
MQYKAIYSFVVKTLNDIEFKQMRAKRSNKWINNAVLGKNTIPHF